LIDAGAIACPDTFNAMSEAGQKTALERLQTFIGEWSVTASFPGSAAGRSVFEWALGQQYLIQRTEAPDPAPDSIAIVAVDPKTGTYTQHYFDSRGVVRVYVMTFDGHSWILTRTSPDFSPLDFSQRFRGKLIGDAISGTWETSRDGVTWQRDFDLTYTRVRS
jgi:hypothetical protein